MAKSYMVEIDLIYSNVVPSKRSNVFKNYLNQHTWGAVLHYAVIDITSNIAHLSTKI